MQKHFGMLFLVFVTGEPGVGGRSSFPIPRRLYCCFGHLFLVSVPKVFFVFCFSFSPLSFAVSSYDDLVGFSLSRLLLRN